MELAIFAGVAVALAGLAVWLDPTRRLKRQLRAARTMKIAELDDGQIARIVGRAGVLADEPTLLRMRPPVIISDDPSTTT